MLKIGDFSTLSKISIHMLRNYDKIGLLVPAQIDAVSGYRYYAEHQLVVANRIQALKSMGLGLNTIKTILSEYKDSDSLATYLSIQATNKREELEELNRQLRQIETVTMALKKSGNVLHYSIEIKEIPQRIVASIRDNIPSYDKEGSLWDILFATLGQHQIPISNLSYDMAIYHDEGFVESNVDVELQISVARKGTDTEKVKYKETAAMQAAVLTYEGEYRHISEIGELIANWAKDNHYEFCGSHFNIYHISPKTEENSSKMVTEVGFPVKSINAKISFAAEKF